MNLKTVIEFEHPEITENVTWVSPTRLIFKGDYIDGKCFNNYLKTEQLELVADYIWIVDKCFITRDILEIYLHCILIKSNL